MIKDEISMNGQEVDEFVVEISEDTFLEINESFSLTLVALESSIVLLQEETIGIEIVNDDGMWNERMDVCWVGVNLGSIGKIQCARNIARGPTVAQLLCMLTSWCFR